MDWPSQYYANDPDIDVRAMALLRQSIQRFYPNDVDRICSLCSFAARPLGFCHADIFVELIPAELSQPVLDQVRVGYVLLSSYYFLLDATVDGHTQDKCDPLYLSHLLAGAILCLEQACLDARPEAVSEFHRLLSNSISANAAAVESEFRFREHPLQAREDEEYDNIVGRSSSFMFLYDFLSLVSDRLPPLLIRRALSDFIFNIQLGDDLADWREDYKAGRFTSVLRYCFQRLGYIATEPEIEQELFLSGLFERRLCRILNRYKRILSDVQSSIGSTNRFSRFIDWHRSRIHELLRQCVTYKYDTLVEHCGESFNVQAE